jgi:hypothetical protein
MPFFYANCSQSLDPNPLFPRESVQFNQNRHEQLNGALSHPGRGRSRQY